MSILAGKSDFMQFKFHHVALAVVDITKATDSLKPIGFSLVEELPDIIDEVLEVKARYMQPAYEGPVVEIVQNLSEKGPIAKILERNGPTLYHMCFEVEDLDAACAFLRKEGYLPISKPKLAKAYNQRRIQFLYHNSSGLIELIEANTKENNKSGDCKKKLF